MIMLDTDIMIDLLRRFPPAVAWLSALYKLLSRTSFK